MLDHPLLHSLLVAIVTSFITVKLSLRQFKAQHWWEKKVTAYSAVLGAIFQMKLGNERCMSAHRNGTQNDEAIKLYRAAYECVRQTSETCQFILCYEAENQLTILKNEIAGSFENNTYEGQLNYYGQMQDEEVALEKCLRELPAIARRDLGVDDSSFEGP